MLNDKAKEKREKKKYYLKLSIKALVAFILGLLTSYFLIHR